MEPIAVVGIGCRFPQANNPASFWQLLREGQKAIRSVPADRWHAEDFYDPTPLAKGKTASCKGGFLDDIGYFDADFFGISAEEAQHIDPQQRLFLEVAWEALEHAGIPPLSLRGSATGVFTGLCTIDYHRLLYRDFRCIGPHSGTGTTMSITANRLSYLLDLRGPSMAVDAACASALVSVHLACQSLRSQESNLCVVGGVNLILSPDSMISSSQTGLLSMQGACRPFDASADGYVRGEGCGVVVLKRLSAAVKENDTVLAVIRGSAVNQDGLSNSLTAPNGRAQQALIRRALDLSGTAADEIDYVEAHAVGTPLGDAIEFKALKQVFAGEGAQARSQPCILGSLKPNIGHLEAASGIAALIKVILSIQHEEIPPQLNFDKANPYVALESSGFEIALEGRAWAQGQRRRLAGVSTFGFGGTNAHLILEEPPEASALEGSTLPDIETPDIETLERSHHLLALTAKSPSALRQLAARYAGTLSADRSASTAALADICFTAHTGRSHFAERVCFISRSVADLQRQLTQFSEGEETVLASQFMTGHVTSRQRPNIVFHFPEPTAETLSIGNTLYQTQPIFRDIFDQCASQTSVSLSFESSVKPGKLSNSQSPVLSSTEQMTGGVICYALAKLWQHLGVQPSAITGEGLGNTIGVCVAGLTALDDMLRSLATGQQPEHVVSTAQSPPLKSPLVSSLVSSLGAQKSQMSILSPHADLSDYEIILMAGWEKRTEVWPQLLSQIAQLYLKGVPIDWSALDWGYRRQRLSLPTYPFERSHHWFEQFEQTTDQNCNVGEQQNPSLYPLRQVS